MANNIWSSLGSTDGNLAGNWSLGWVPKAGDVAYFDVTSVINCTFSGNITCDGIDVQAAYTGNIDFGDTKTHTWGASGFIIKGSGNKDLGTGTTHNISDAIWSTYLSSGTWAVGTSIVISSGSCTFRTSAAEGFYNFTIADGIANFEYDLLMIGTCIINGTLSVDSLRSFHARGTVTLGDGARVTGLGTFRVYIPGAGSGITSFHPGATWDIANFLILRPNIASVIVPGNYQSATVFQASSAANITLTLEEDGVYQFDSFKMYTSSTGTLTLANNTNGPTSITILGDLTIEDTSGAIITINDSTQSVEWDIRGSIVDVRSGDTFVWVKGTGTLTASGAANQDWDLMGENPGDVEVDKSAGTLTISGDFLADSFLGTAGTLDPNGQAIETTGNFTTVAGFVTTNAADVMNGCAITVGGNLSLAGRSGTLLRLLATAAWTLDVTGTAVATFVEVEYSDASGGTEIYAINYCIDGLNNTNWNFATGMVGIVIGYARNPYLFLGPLGSKQIRIGGR